jgi:hypothetical protein
MADSTLVAIRKKIRRITRTPSEQQLATTDIDEYINTFILYDLPQNLSLDKLRSTLTFYTEPYIDTYETSSTVGDPLYDFENKYTNVYAPVYIAGHEGYLSNSEVEFNRFYPFINSQVSEATGNGATTIFTGTLNTIPVLRNKVTFNSIDANNNGLVLYDDGAGTLDGDGIGTINYITGAYSLSFSIAPASGADINSLTVSYNASRPSTVLFFNNKFIVRPIPDQVYPIQIEVDMKPTELLLDTDSPDLKGWWQYIAYGASKKIFEDRNDIESVNAIMPEFKNQEILVSRRSIKQQTQERAATIYSQGFNISCDSSWPPNN